MNPFISESELSEIAGVKQQSKLITWLRENEIRYKFTNGKKREVWTTQKQVDDSFGNVRKDINFG